MSFAKGRDERGSVKPPTTSLHSKNEKRYCRIWSHEKPRFVRYYKISLSDARPTHGATKSGLGNEKGRCGRKEDNIRFFRQNADYT